jgi:dTDP-4-dehydrorhamnose 3,5-epimerase
MSLAPPGPATRVLDALANVLDARSLHDDRVLFISGGGRRNFSRHRSLNSSTDRPASMRLLETRLEGPKLIEPAVFRDERGFFCETYRRSAFAELGMAEEMVQDNHSLSARGVVRGMHFQVGAGVAKLVRCARGAILDVVVDIRPGSPTFGQWEAFELDAQKMRLAYCPIGFAHGFCVLSEQADVVYKQSGYYAPETERGIRYDDPNVGIEWPADLELTVSSRDASAPLLRDVADQLPFEYRP